MTLLGHTIIYCPAEKNPAATTLALNYNWKVDASCISPKENCVSHIFITSSFWCCKRKKAEMKNRSLFKKE